MGVKGKNTSLFDLPIHSAAGLFLALYSMTEKIREESNPEESAAATRCSSLARPKPFVWKNHMRFSHLVYFHTLLCGARLWVWRSEDAKFCFDQSTGISLHVGDVEAHYPEVRALRNRVD